LDNQDLLLTKKLLLTYKEKLENEIINRSSKLKIPKNFYENTITKNEEIIKLKKALEEIEKNSIELKKIEE
tara:strand:- start:1438 stop:1650 length:213 start_codon:yes stop_codon:yes gene_type:complete